MPTPIESLRSQVETSTKNHFEAVVNEHPDAFKVQPRVVEDFLKRQLAIYKAQLRSQRNGTSKPIGKTTIEHRERGAEDFFMFLLGIERKTERIRSGIKRGRVR